MLCLDKHEFTFFDKKIRLTGLIIVCIIVMIATAAITYLVTVGSYGSRQYLADAKQYIEIEKTIEENYIGDAEPQLLFDAAASAMVKSIDDKWSYYMSPAEYEAYKLSSGNEYQGIGVSIETKSDGSIIITAVENGTPAYKAGITVGQELLSVDGQEVRDMSIEEISTLIRSKLNKDFKVTVLDDGDERSFTLSCAVIYKNPVSSRMIDDHIAYIKISNFEAGASENTTKAIERLITAGADSFIFDVRGNPGGLVSELVSLLDYILPEGDLFVSIDKNGKENVQRSDKVSLMNKMVVLVDENTYSAAEFFAAALQEYNWATVIGAHTTGKARSQVTIELSNGGAVHISTHKYLTPDRVDLSEAGGITPDISPESQSTGADAVLEAARKALS